MGIDKEERFRIKLDDDLLTRIKKALNDVEGLEFAALFGSLITIGGSHHDIDIAVKASGRDKYSSLCKVIEVLSRSLGIPEEQIDLVDLDRADLELKKEVMANGVIILDKIGYRERLVKELNTSYPEYGENRRISIDEWLRLRDPSSINLEIVKRRLEFIRRETDFLEGNVLSKGVSEVKESPILQRLIERSFHLIIEAVLDICRHIVSVMGWGPALSYSDFITLCFKHKVMDEALKERLINYVRIRNIIIHRYLDVDYEKLYEESVELEKIIKKFERQLLNFIKSLK